MVDFSVEWKVLELRSKGLSYREIAKILGISHTTVWRIVRKYLTQETLRNVTVTSHRGNIYMSHMSQSDVTLPVTTNLNEKIQGLIEYIKTIENNLDKVLSDVNELRHFKEFLIYVSRLRVEGSTRCKYIDDYGYCTKMLLPQCPSNTTCLEVIYGNGVKMFRVKVVENPLICLPCPHYKPKKLM